MREQCINVLKTHLMETNIQFPLLLREKLVKRLRKNLNANTMFVVHEKCSMEIKRQRDRDKIENNKRQCTT